MATVLGILEVEPLLLLIIEYRNEVSPVLPALLLSFPERLPILCFHAVTVVADWSIAFIAVSWKIEKNKRELIEKELYVEPGCSEEQVD